ncbi:DUF262 domain-containing protein [Hydrogenophaga atypica]|uniref:DUF262 domain-containing protein n=1 Tax=Hydrogenophaga atypica TaxID=249409 RepID=A0ABW2QR09_9BURK
MTSADPPIPVRVEVLSFASLFNESADPLAVDTYQRGFVWNEDKVRQLADDLSAYQQKADLKPPYYMGTVLIHHHADKKKRFLIDGQQRITALCLLHWQLNNSLPTKCALSYSPKSARRIRTAVEVLRKHRCTPDAGIFDQIVFTVISVDRVDLAFTFFDTQNNRGLPLHATDLLKAYHLRAVGADADADADAASVERKEALQTLCAQRWEGIQRGAPVMSHDQEFAQSLFVKFLWRARYWTGQRVTLGGHNALMEEFQKHTWENKGDPATMPLYRSRHNQLGTALTLGRDGHGEIHTNRISLSPRAEDLPFAIRQPIHKGIGFFLYADKYAALLRRLVVDPTDSVEVLHFREVYEKLLMANSLFLREIFLLAAVMFADQFEDEKLWEFSLWLDHALGAIRLEKEQVRYEAAQNFFKQDTLNLLDVIASGYRPEQVVAHLKANHTHAKTYSDETIEAGKGVQGVYKQAVLTYYGRGDATSLNGKHAWIDTKLEGVLA